MAQQRRSSASSGVSSQSEGGLTLGRKTRTDFLHRVRDLRKRSFCEFFFHALPLVAHPIIILRLICHMVFGNMLRRKTTEATESQHLSPPVVKTDDASPPMPSDADTENANYDAALTQQTPASSDVTRKPSKHVQIAQVESEVWAGERRESEKSERRSDSIDRHLLFGGGRKRFSNGDSVEQVRQAIRTFGESLIHPLELMHSDKRTSMSRLAHASASDDSPPTHDVDAPATPSQGASERTGLLERSKAAFRFPILHKHRNPSAPSKRKTSQSFFPLSSDDVGVATSYEPTGASSRSSLCDKSLRDFEKELINLPTFEVDTHSPHATETGVGWDKASVIKSTSVPELDLSKMKRRAPSGQHTQAYHSANPPLSADPSHSAHTTASKLGQRALLSRDQELFRFSVESWDDCEASDASAANHDATRVTQGLLVVNTRNAKHRKLSSHSMGTPCSTVREFRLPALPSMTSWSTFRASNVAEVESEAVEERRAASVKQTRSAADLVEHADANSDASSGNPQSQSSQSHTAVNASSNRATRTAVVRQVDQSARSNRETSASTPPEAEAISSSEPVDSRSVEAARSGGVNELPANERRRCGNELDALAAAVDASQNTESSSAIKLMTSLTKTPENLREDNGANELRAGDDVSRNVDVDVAVQASQGRSGARRFERTDSAGRACKSDSNDSIADDATNSARLPEEGDWSAQLHNSLMGDDALGEASRPSLAIDVATVPAIKVRFREATPCASPSLSSLASGATPTLEQAPVSFAHHSCNACGGISQRRASDVSALIHFTKGMETPECINQAPCPGSMTSGVPPNDHLHQRRDVLALQGVPRATGVREQGPHNALIHQTPPLSSAGAARGRRNSSAAAPSTGCWLGRVGSNHNKAAISEKRAGASAVNLSAPGMGERKTSSVYTTSPSSPLCDVSVQHQGIMRVIETWIDVCPLDLDGSKMVRKETKDFLKKMSSLGPLYRQWALSMHARLRLDVRTWEDESVNLMRVKKLILIFFRILKPMVDPLTTRANCPFTKNI